VTEFSLGHAARILKVSPRRLRYWQQTELFTQPPPESDEDGYAFRDLVCLRTIVSLLDKGIPLQRIRRNLDMLRARLPEMDDPAAALRLWGEHSDRIVVRRDGRFEDAGGQLLLEFEERSEDAVEGGASVSELASGESADGVTSLRDAAAWFEHGCALDAEPGRWEDAIEAYEKALALEPGYVDAICNIGAIRYNQGRGAEARKAFEACLALDTDHVEGNFNLANVLEEGGEDERALGHYLRALAGDPLYPDLHINLALLYEKLSRSANALDHWRRYLQLDPRGSWAEVARLRMAREAGKEEPSSPEGGRGGA